MKSSEALKLVYDAIQRREETYVCIALKYAVVGACPKPEVCAVLAELFPGVRTVESWLAYNSVEYRDWKARLYDNCQDDPGMFYAQFNRVMREYRLMWINQMIADYEAKGD